VDEVAANSALQLFPNPATDVLNVILPAGVSLSDVRMMDALGRSLPVSIHNGTVHLSSLSPGIYVLRAMHDGQEWCTRFEKR
jgi:hypothetical protein